MDFYDVVKARRSCRVYTAQKVSKDAVDRILSAFRAAPSWKNSQCWHLIMISDRELISRLSDVMNNNPGPTAYSLAPYIFVLVADPAVSGVMGDKPYYMVDCGIALEHFCLAAAAEGLGTCWVGLFNEENVKQLLGIPDNMRVVALTPLGYPGENPYRDKPRREVGDIVHTDLW